MVKRKVVAYVIIVSGFGKMILVIVKTAIYIITVITILGSISLLVFSVLIPTW